MADLNLDTVGSYLQEIGRFPLLKPDQEIAYARLVQHMVALEQAKSALTDQLHREPTTSELAASLDKTETEIRLIIHQGQRAKQKMVTANLRLVVSIAKKYQQRNLEFLDLIQEGTLGLQRGVEKFDPNKGYRLSTYTYWWITQAITRAIAEKSRTVRLPNHVSEKLNRIKRVQRRISQALGRSATIPEIAQALKLQPEQIREYLNASRGTISLELRVGDNKDTELGDILPIDNTDSDEQLHQELLHQELNSLLGYLNPIQRQVLVLRFGLDDNQELSFHQIGQRLNMSRERARQIQYQAFDMMRRHRSNVQDYLAS